MALGEVFARTLLEMVMVKKWNSKAIKINCHQLQHPVSTQRSGRRQRWVYSRKFCSCNTDRIEIGLEVCVAWICDLTMSAKAQDTFLVAVKSLFSIGSQQGRRPMTSHYRDLNANVNLRAGPRLRLVMLCMAQTQALKYSIA